MLILSKYMKWTETLRRHCRQ